MGDDLERVEGDGAVSEVRKADAADELRALKDAVSEIREEVADAVAARRATARDTLLCEWTGQSSDGRKRAADLRRDPLPFEGASDNRVRLVDMIAAEHKRQIVGAAMRATPKAVGTEGDDAAGAARIETLLRWLVRNQWGSGYRRALELLAYWQEVDTPAGSICMVDWEREFAVRPKRITPEDVIGMYLAAEESHAKPQGREEDGMNVAATGASPVVGPGGAALGIAEVVFNTEREADLAEVLLRLVPELRPARARQAARALQRDGFAEVPEKYARLDLPAICPMRLYEDVFFPANTTELQRARLIVRREWLSRAEVLERTATYGWSDSFATALVGDSEQNIKGHEAESAFDDADDTRIVNRTGGETEPRRGLYEVLTAYRRAANEDGGIGIYVTSFSAFVDEPARGTELFDRDHGLYPFVYFPREIMSGRLIDSRGLPEVLQTDQQSMKLLKDSFEDHVQTTTNPPIKVPPNKPRFRLVFAPFGQIEANARENVEFMQRPPYPQAADLYWREIRHQVNEYVGRPGADVDPVLVQLAMQDRVDRFLASLADVMMMVVQLCQQYMTDAQIQRVVGGGGMAIARSVAEIQGKYDIQLSYDVRDLDMELVVKKAKVILENIKPLDVRAVLPYEAIVSRLLSAIDPNLADMVATVQQADAREIADERAAFVSMLNGVEPPMPNGGINAALRLQTLDQLIGERNTNPAAYPPVSPISQAMVENRMKYLTFQQQQQQNADIGRVGTEPVRPEEVGNSTSNAKRPTSNVQVGAMGRG